MSKQKQVAGDETARWHDFGAWLAQTRVDLGHTLAHVAAQAGISTQSLVSLEHGGFRRYADGPWILPNPRDDTLRSLAGLYGVEAEEMFKRVGHYEDRPQTRSSLRRRGRASSRQAARGDRLSELAGRLEALEAERQERLDRIAALEAELAEMRKAHEARIAEMERELREREQAPARPARRRATG